MKFIFDFDDTLFHTSKSLRPQIFSVLEKVGISRDKIEDFIEKSRLNNKLNRFFSLKKMLHHFNVREALYEEIMKDCENCVNEELIEIVKKIGKNDCYIVSYGDEEFQLDKINRTNIATLFSEIHIVSDSKKETIEAICVKHNKEKVVFFDDNDINFKDLDIKKCPNLKTILYTGQNLENLIQ